MTSGRLFPSFWMAGFECSSQIHYRGRGRLDYTAELGHDTRCDEDYGVLAQFGIRTVRDGIRWHLIERRPGRFDFSTVDPLRRAAQKHGVLVIWDVCHYGWPEDVDPLRPDFPDRYARLARAFARYIRDHSDAVPYYAPINEISFLAWCTGEVAIFAPFGRNRGHVAKLNYIRAAIAGIEAIWEVDPRARIVHTDPLIRTIAPPHRPELIRAARDKHESQFQAWDMLAGRLEPQLGGDPRYLDILGFNFYPHNQWEVDGITLTRRDRRWVDLHELLATAYERYRRPFFIAETCGRGPTRGPWLEYVAEQSLRTLERGLPLQGVCLYPIIDAPDWNTGLFLRCALWDVEPQPGDRLARVLNEPYAQALLRAQEKLMGTLGTRSNNVGRGSYHTPQRRVSAREGEMPSLQGCHICFFTDSLEPSGVGVHLLNLMRWLEPARFQMSLVCPDTPGGRRLMAAAARLGAEVVPLTVRDHRDKGSIRRLADLLRRERVDVFHSQVGISWEGLLGLQTAYAARVPVRVVTEHLPYLLTHPGQVAEHRRTTRLADRVITVSEGSRRTFLARGYPAEQFICIHNGIEPPRRHTGRDAATRQSLQVPPTAPLLLTVARMTPQKGHDVLLDASPALLARYPEAVLAWVGDGPERERLEQRAQALGVGHSVRFLGQRDDVPALMTAADLFVLPSRFEGHPLVVLEALACGLAVVGTRVCGLEEAVAHGETGLLIDPERPEELVDAVAELLAAPERRAQMGQAGQRLVHERFHARHMARATAALYDELLAEKRVHRGRESSASESGGRAAQAASRAS